MTTTSNRHRMIEVKCEWCETPFMARKQRVDNGQSRFCSREHHREWLKSIPSQRNNIGKENAKFTLDPNGHYRAYWFDLDTRKHKTTTWAKWTWELNFGEVPEGYRVSFKDNNPLNTVLENLRLKSWEEYGEELGDKKRGVPRTEEAKAKMSASHSGKTLSEEHKAHIADANRKRWAKGDFDSVHKGENNLRWRGGVNNGYPREFVQIKDFIKERDNYTCQICGKAVYRSRHGHVHHMDGNREHNDPENLVLLCSSCHLKVHSTNPTSPVIMAFRSLLEWNQVEEQ